MAPVTTALTLRGAVSKRQLSSSMIKLLQCMCAMTCSKATVIQLCLSLKSLVMYDLHRLCWDDVEPLGGRDTCLPPSRISGSGGGVQRDKAEDRMPAHQVVVHHLGRGRWVQKEIRRCEDGDEHSLAGGRSRTERSGAAGRLLPGSSGTLIRMISNSDVPDACWTVVTVQSHHVMQLKRSSQ